MKKDDIDKLMNETVKHRYKCKCGNTVTIYPFEHIERKICDWCGYYVYKDPKEQSKYDFRNKLMKKMSKNI